MNQTMLHTADASSGTTRMLSLGERAVYGVSLATVLPVAMAASLTGWRWQPWPPGSNGYKSAFREAMLTARNVTAIAFSAK